MTISGTTTNLTSDADGNQTGYVTSNQKVTTQTFNEAGRLATVQYSGSTLESNTYDGFGQRIYATGTDGDRLYTYGPDRTLLEQSEGKTGTVQADYIYVDGQPVAAIEPIVGSTDSKILYLHTNALGAPQKVTDSSKKIVWAANYTPFGGTDVSAAAIVQNLRLPGQENSDATPFEQNGFRAYANQIGRYIQPDLIGLAGGSNPFAYAGNNPLRNIDPRGLSVGNVLRKAWEGDKRVARAIYNRYRGAAEDRVVDSAIDLAKENSSAFTQEAISDAKSAFDAYKSQQNMKDGACKKMGVSYIQALANKIKSLSDGASAAAAGIGPGTAAACDIIDGFAPNYDADTIKKVWDADPQTIDRIINSGTNPNGARYSPAPQ